MAPPRHHGARTRLKGARGDAMGESGLPNGQGGPGRGGGPPAGREKKKKHSELPQAAPQTEDHEPDDDDVAFFSKNAQYSSFFSERLSVQGIARVAKKKERKKKVDEDDKTADYERAPRVEGGGDEGEGGDEGGSGGMQPLALPVKRLDGTAGLYKWNAVFPAIESVWFQPFIM